jgi:zinc/manganese transport system permease protein
MGAFFKWVIEPGFFSSSPVRVALLLGGVIAGISSVVGVFTVLRGQSFGGHALTDVSTAGGSGALLIGVAPVAGFVAGGVVGAGVMEAIGVRRPRGRDLATGIVLGAATGLAALFLYLDSTTSATTGAAQQILFGSIFVVASSTIRYVIVFGGVALGLVCLLYRPLLLSSLSSDMAMARGISVRGVGALYMLALALSVGLSSLVTGTILSTALLIGPPAAALRVTRRMNQAITVSVLIGVGATWLGVLLAYDSYYWGASENGWPVSFFIVAVVFLAYLLSGLPARRVGHKAERATREFAERAAR